MTVSRVAGATLPHAAATTRTSSCNHDTRHHFGEGGRDGKSKSGAIAGVEEPTAVTQREECGGRRISLDRRCGGVSRYRAEGAVDRKPPDLAL